jgi:hypothetical protein
MYIEFGKSRFLIISSKRISFGRKTIGAIRKHKVYFPLSMWKDIYKVLPSVYKEVEADSDTTTTTDDNSIKIDLQDGSMEIEYKDNSVN